LNYYYENCCRATSVIKEADSRAFEFGLGALIQGYFLLVALFYEYHMQVMKNVFCLFALLPLIAAAQPAWIDNGLVAHYPFDGEIRILMGNHAAACGTILGRLTKNHATCNRYYKLKLLDGIQQWRIYEKPVEREDHIPV
jgi:hypothetical protein